MAANLNQFMAAISGQESGGIYDAENPNSGAYGRFQIMPENWPSWSAEAGIGGQSPTPQNQDRIAAFKMQQYYDQFGNWGDVASLWYSGRPLSALSDSERYDKNYTNGVEYPSIQEYVDSITGRLGEPTQGGGGNSRMAQLPFDEKTYMDKYIQYAGLQDRYENYDPLDPATAVSPQDLETMYRLEIELKEYVRIRDTPGSQTNGLSEIERANYWNNNNPARIDAENSANAWARQQQINQQALGGTANAMGEQRLTADSANAETEAYKKSSVFSGPMGFRVGSIDLPTEDEVFASQIEKASKNLPAVTPIPYSQNLSAPGTGNSVTRPSVVPPGAGSNPERTVAGSRGLDDDPFASRPLPNTPSVGRWQGPINPDGQWQGPINPDGQWQGPINPNPSSAPDLNKAGAQVRGLVSSVLGRGNPPPLPSGVPDLNKAGARVRRYVGSIFGGR